MNTLKKSISRNKKKINYKTRKQINKVVKPSNYSSQEKDKFVQEINPLSLEDAEKSWNQLKELSKSCSKLSSLSSASRIGNNVVDYFTLRERLSTKGHLNVSFYDLWYNRNYFSQFGYIQKMLKYYESRQISDIRKWKYIYNVYFSSISVFKPTVAMDIYCKYPSRKAILDMTMGWGGRLFGACALNCPKYIGIDLNRNLKKDYDKMKEFLREKTTTEIELYFQNALDFDYSKIEYDIVLTSPPYYDLEIYENMREYKNKDLWNKEFYIPLFERTWKHLNKGGYYCLNVSNDIYENVCIQVFGKCHKKHLLKKNTRIKSKAHNYKEYIYVWKK